MATCESPVKDLGQPVYLFGCQFPFKQTGKTREYPLWNENVDHRKNKDLKNVRPLPFIPVVVNIASNADSDENPMLWGTSTEGRLYSLGVGTSCHQDVNNHNILRQAAPLYELCRMAS
ncbi:hypothetical protein [Moritella viscosa]|uniref:hypothetical protein n=1 Tax=Moritella viscosa TaxID=80854 RepID=UPI0009207E35|nr:hypothetical protein [Moritella viscosa]SGZ02276.1 Putative uncharacterized protein [Moritella viscosa]